MLLTCPNCAAGYEVPDHVLDGPPRMMRCALCATEWEARSPLKSAESVQATIAEPMAELDLPAAVRLAPEPLAQMNAGIVRDGQVRRGVIGWALSLAVLGIIGWAGVHWRHDVEATWPPSARAYQAVGLD